MTQLWYVTFLSKSGQETKMNLVGSPTALHKHLTSLGCTNITLNGVKLLSEKRGV